MPGKRNHVKKKDYCRELEDEQDPERNGQID